MALSKFTLSLMNGVGTSTSGAIAHSRTAIRVNAAIDAFNMLNADTSRTRSEKAPLYKKLQEQHGRAIEADLERFASELLQRTENYEQQVEKVLSSVSLADAVQIVAGLKAAGLKNDQLLSAVADSAEIAVAMARVPQALSGLTPDVAKAAAIKHYPALVQLGEENERDFSSYSSLSRVVDKTVLTIGMNIDQQALAARFDESKLAPQPEPKTMAEQNAIIDQATKEQAAEHVGMYGATHLDGGPKPSAK